MSTESILRRLATSAAFILLASTSASIAQESVVLDAIVVESDSPVARDASDGEGQEPGTLIVTDDAFVPVTVTTAREILSTQGGNIADALDTKPGIAGSTYAPGANRPVIRGLDNYRVRIQENGIGSHDVSDLSEDHAVPIDPYAATKVEVIRGPATLRYGSTAIGGVVAVENERIPTYIPEGGFTAELQGALSSVDDGKDGAMSATVGGDFLAFHFDGFRRTTDDYDTPDGTVENSFTETDGFAVGGSAIGKKGFIGVSFSRYFNKYGLPVAEEEEHEEHGDEEDHEHEEEEEEHGHGHGAAVIDMKQERFQAKGEWRARSSGIQAVRFWFGYSDYKHFELISEEDEEEHDEDEHEADHDEDEHEHGETEIGAEFYSEVYEFRTELQHMPINSSFGTLNGAIGFQFFDKDVTVISNEGDDLLKPSDTESFGFFIFEELELSDSLTLQAASRIEHTEVSGQNRVEPLNFALPLSKFNNEFTPYSGSLGMTYRFQSDDVFSLLGQYVERAPADAELYSAGLHEATETFEVGNPYLEKEKAFTIEAGLRRKKGPFRYDATAYYTKFDGFIFKDFTGIKCGEFANTCGEEDELDLVLFQQEDATFYGVEIAAQYDVASLWRGVWGVDGQFDFVKAEFDGGANVPRIPPARLGGGIYYRDSAFFARAGVLHAFDQDDIGEFEEETPGYTLVSAEMSYTEKQSDLGFGPEFTIGIKGTNLLDEEVLNHTSFRRRDEILQPGQSVRVFGRVKLN